MNTSSAAATNTQTVARNSFWYGLELVFNIVAAFLTSIIVARAVGPVRLGPFNYIMWLTNVTTSVGSFGLPMTTRKYMAEHLNSGDAGVAHAIYRFALTLQIAISSAIVVLGVGFVFWAGDPGYHWISIVLVAAMAPRMIGFIPSQANSAAEMMRWNTKPALIGGAINIVGTLASIWIGWGLMGVAGSVLAGAVVELVMKARTVQRWLGPKPVAPISPELKRRLFSYSGQGVVLMLLNVVVWDKSDMFVLKKMNSDIRQITFFSIAFNLTDRVLKLPEAFGTSLSVTMMAQYGRGREKLPLLTAVGAKYSFLLALPLLAGVACLSAPFVTVYGKAYAPLAPVLTVAALLAIPKALISSPTALLQATENQGFLIWTGCVCGALDIGLDFLLTPGYGAMGAAVANGIAQTAAAAAIWYRVHRMYGMGPLFSRLARITLAGAAMAAVVVLTGRALPGYVGVALSIVVGALVWLVALRVAGGLDADDRERFRHVGKALPGRVRPMFDRVVALLA